MTYEQENEITTEDDFDAMDEEAIIIDNAAVFSIDYDAQQLIIYFGGTRNAIMELDSDKEVMLCDMVLSDPNFWANFLGSFSAALKKDA